MLSHKLILALGALSLGVVLGYVGRGEAQKENAETLSESILSGQQRAPRLGEKNKGWGMSSEAKDQTRPKSLQEVLNQKKLPNSRLVDVANYLAGLSSEQLKEEIKKMRTLPSEEQEMIQSLIFSRWAEVDPKQAMKYAAKLGFGGLPSMLQTWVAKDPEAAVAYCHENKQMLGRESYSAMAREWSKHDVQSALAWAESLSGNTQEPALAEVLSKLVETDLALVREKMSALPEDMKWIQSKLAEKMAKKDWASTESWLESLSGNQKEMAKINALIGLSSVNPDQAMREIEKMPSGGTKDAVVQQIGALFAVENPQEAADWVLKNASLKDKQTAAYVARSWAQEDALAAQKWVLALPEGRGKEWAISEYVRTTPSKDYNQSLEMACSIKDESNRSWALHSVSVKWMRDDTLKAKEWVEATPLLKKQEKDLIFWSY